MAAVDEFVQQLRRRQIQGSTATAKRTAEILRLLVTKSRRPTPEGMLNDVCFVGMRMQAAKPLELAVGNIVRRVLHLVREEADLEDADSLAVANSMDHDSHSPAPGRGVTFAESEEKRPAVGKGLLSRALRPGGLATRTLSLHNLLDQSAVADSAVEWADRSTGAGGPSSPEQAVRDHAAGGSGVSSAQVSAHPSSEAMFSPTASKAGSEAGEGELVEREKRPSIRSQRQKAEVWKRRSNIIEEMNDLVDELDQIDGLIAAQAPEHVHANEVILTFQATRAVTLFLREAAKKRSFQLVVAEGAPTLEGQSLAADMAAGGTPTTLILDAAIFAMMARVNKVVVGAHALLANGGVIAAAGTALVAAAARKHAVPLVVLVGLHQLSPLFPHDPVVTMNDFRSPGTVLEYDAIADTLSADTPEADSNAESTYLHAPSPMYDYVAPELISLFVTDTGGYTGRLRPFILRRTRPRLSADRPLSTTPFRP